MTTVLGYGSLLNLHSARRTLPRLRRGDFTPVVVTGFRRRFNLVSRSRREAVKEALLAGEKVGALNAIPAPGGQEMGAVALVLTDLELQALDDREFCYRRVEGVRFRHFYTGVELGEGIVYSVLSAAHLRERMPGTYRDRIEPLGADGLLSDLILPDRQYLQTCLRGAISWGQPFADHFLDHTFLADGRRSLRPYLSSR